MSSPNLWFVKATTELHQFSERLHEVCTDKGLPAERGRQTALAEQFSVTPNAARKWLLGLGMPELPMAIKIAVWASVNVEWLLTGRGPKHGQFVETKAVMLGEAIADLPDQDRQQALDFVRYKIERAQPVFTGERLARYMKMLDNFSAAPKSKPKR